MQQLAVQPSSGAPMLGGAFSAQQPLGNAFLAQQPMAGAFLAQQPAPSPHSSMQLPFQPPAQQQPTQQQQRFSFDAFFQVRDTRLCLLLPFCAPSGNRPRKGEYLVMLACHLSSPNLDATKTGAQCKTPQMCPKPDRQLQGGGGPPPTTQSGFGGGQPEGLGGLPAMPVRARTLAELEGGGGGPVPGAPRASPGGRLL